LKIDNIFTLLWLQESLLSLVAIKVLYLKTILSFLVDLKKLILILSLFHEGIGFAIVKELATKFDGLIYLTGKNSFRIILERILF
jgi:hypothetical protein